MKTLLPLLLILLLATAAQAQDVFQVHGVNNCGGAAQGVTRTLGPGLHYFLLDGAMSNWSYDGANGGKTWLTWVRIHDYSTGVSTYYGGTTGRQATSALADAEVEGVVFEFELATTSTVSFHFTDSPCGDNRGGTWVTLDDPGVVATDRSSWGAVKAIYR